MGSKSLTKLIEEFTLRLVFINAQILLPRYSKNVFILNVIKLNKYM